MFPVFVVMGSLTILISRVKWNFSFKLQRVDVKYRQTLAARGGGDGLFTSILVPRPPSSALALSRHRPLPRRAEISSVSSCSPQDWDFFPLLCETFLEASGPVGGGGVIFFAGLLFHF